MEQQTLELLRALQSGERDAGAFKYIRTLLPQERTRLAAAEDRATLADISELLEVWADSASSELAGAAAAEAAQIADEDLEQAERAAQLYQLGLERAPKELEPLRKLDALFCRRGQHERLEAALVAHAERLRAASDAQPAAVAGVYRRLGQLRAERGSDLSPAIEAYERALDLAVDTDIIRELADLYAKRRGQGDDAQAADLYCMLAEVSGAADGVAMLERALDLAPGHDAALELLESYVPVVDHPSALQGRWAAYIERSDNEQGVDLRRGLLARAYAAQGQQRNALICLGPLIEKGDAEALRMQVAVLAALQAQEQRESAPAARAKSGNGAIVRPSTLVGFRVPAPDEADAADEAAGEANREDAPSEITPAQDGAVEAAPEVVANAAHKGEAKLVRQSAVVAAEHRDAKPVQQSEAKPVRQSTAVAAEHKDAQPLRQSEAKPVRQSTAVAAERKDAKPLRQSEAKPVRQSAAMAAERKDAALVGQGEAKPAERTDAQPVRQAETKALRVRPARSGETLVGFRLPEALTGLEARSPGFAKGQQSVVGGQRAKAERADKRAKADTKPEAKGAAARGPVSSMPAASAKTVAAAESGGAAVAARTSRPSAAVPALQSPARVGTSGPRASSQPAAPAGAAAKAAALRASRSQAAFAGAPAALGAAASAQRAPAPRSSAPAPQAPRVSSRPAVMAAAPAVAARVSAPPVFPVAPQPALAQPGSVAAPFAEARFDVDEDFPPAQPVAGDKRWLIAGGIAVALTVTVGVLALGPGSKPSSSVAPTRGEAVAPQPAAAPMPEPPSALPPSAGAATSAAAAPSPPRVEPGGPSAAPATSVAGPTSAASPVHDEPAPRSKKSAKTSPAGRLVPGKAHVVGGGLSAQQIALVLEDTLPLIERCYAEALDDKPRLQGRAVFGWTIERNGHPTHVRTLSGTLKDDTLQQCSLEALRKARFPKPKKKSSEITWPLDFKKS